jgi:hypothetical protein
MREPLVRAEAATDLAHVLVKDPRQRCRARRPGHGAVEDGSQGCVYEVIGVEPAVDALAFKGAEQAPSVSFRSVKQLDGHLAIERGAPGS